MQAGCVQQGRHDGTQSKEAASREVLPFAITSQIIGQQQGALGDFLPQLLSHHPHGVCWRDLVIKAFLPTHTIS